MKILASTEFGILQTGSGKHFSDKEGAATDGVVMSSLGLRPSRFSASVVFIYRLQTKPFLPSSGEGFRPHASIVLRASDISCFCSQCSVAVQSVFK